MTSPEQQSPVPGFRLQDFDIGCSVNPAQLCPAKAHLVSLYVGNAGQEGVPADISQRDSTVLTLKLAEYGLRAKSGSCDDNAEVCAIRTAMDESQARQTAVRGIRWFVGIFRKNR
ncbi:MAG: hypothetical protein WBP26_02140 [Candidatus Saccharimonadales bacterium]